MKRIIILFICLLIPLFGYSQNNVVNSDDETIVINVGKISKGLGKAVRFIKNEIKQFKVETDQNLDPEIKADLDSVKVKLKYELKYTRDAIHAGYVQALRGEDYQPPYKHK